jgi:hypothetical protein
MKPEGILQMTKPLVIVVGANKGGVGKTTLSRALDCYLHEMNVRRKVYDGESPSGDLRQFSPDSEVVDMLSVNDQMKVFDKLRGVTLIDIKAGLFSEVLESLSRTGLLDDVREGHFNLALLHVLGPSAASLAEISGVAASLGAGARHILVKNYADEGGFEEWEQDPRFAAALTNTSNMIVPHLESRAYVEVQKMGVSFSTFMAQSQSRMLIGYIRAWLRDCNAAFAGTGLDRLIEEAK